NRTLETCVSHIPERHLPKTHGLLHSKRPSQTVLSYPFDRSRKSPCKFRRAGPAGRFSRTSWPKLPLRSGVVGRFRGGFRDLRWQNTPFDRLESKKHARNSIPHHFPVVEAGHLAFFRVNLGVFAVFSSFLALLRSGRAIFSSSTPKWLAT